MTSAPESDFDAVVEALLAEPGTSEGTGFGSTPGVKVGGKIAAMLMDDRLVVKLPPERCQELETASGAEPLRIGARTMREWVAVPHGEGDWIALAREALVYVRP
jgi:hypothetical protein